MFRDSCVRLESAVAKVKKPKEAHCNNLILTALELMFVNVVHFELRSCPHALGISSNPCELTPRPRSSPPELGLLLLLYMH